MTPKVRKGLLLAGLHIAVVASLGAKLLADRAMLPRVWAHAAPVDPNLPIRGRYVSLRLEVSAAAGLDVPQPKTVTTPSGQTYVEPPETLWVTLKAQDGKLVAERSTERDGLPIMARLRNGQVIIALREPVPYFIPEGVPDPSIRAAGEELWVEVTLPRRGGPRPIRLGVKKDGVLTPLDLR
jgi:uncharacterized membrane-anchored protein